MSNEEAAITRILHALHIMTDNADVMLNNHETTRVRGLLEEAEAILADKSL